MANEMNDKDLQIELLKARISELESAEKKESSKIPLDEYIPVMSLIPFRLNLSTQEFGTGNVKKFNRFGEVKSILYKDLVDIMEVHSNFLESGYFYILDPRVIRQHGLDDVYSKILTKEKIDEILETTSDQCVSFYSSANEEQQRVIIQLLVDRVLENPESLNLNTIDEISRISGIDILKRVNDVRESQRVSETEE